MSTLIGSFDGLHDNRVLRYCADFESHSLHMDTQTEAGEKVSCLLYTSDVYKRQVYGYVISTFRKKFGIVCG